MTIKIKADNEHPIPERMTMQKAPTPMEELEVAENTAKLMKEHAEPIDITKEDKKEAEKLFKNFQRVSGVVSLLVVSSVICRSTNALMIPVSYAIIFKIDSKLCFK